MRLSNVLDPVKRSIILDLATVAALVDSGMTLLETGLGAIEDDDSDKDE